jgi:hypothetical protein
MSRATLFPEMANRTFQPLVDRLSTGSHGPGFTPDEVRELLSGCQFGAAVLANLSVSFDRMLENGLEADKVRTAVKEFKGVLELVLDTVFPKVRTIVENASLPGDEKQAGLRMLDEADAVHRKRLGEISALDGWLSEPPRKDAGTVAGTRSTQDPNAYLSWDEATSRLNAGS